MFSKEFEANTVHIDWCYNATYKHSCWSQHISVLTTCTYIVRQVWTFILFFKTASAMHSRFFEGRHLVSYSHFLFTLHFDFFLQEDPSLWLGLLSESPCRLGGIPQHRPIKADYPRQAKANYRQGQRQQLQPHFTCGRLVALQCSIHNTFFCHFACRKHCMLWQCFLHAKWQKRGIVDTALWSNESAASEMRLKLLSLALSIDGLGQAPWHSDPTHPEESPQACSGPVPLSIIYPWIPGCQKYIYSQHICGAEHNEFVALHRWETIFPLFKILFFVWKTVIL